MIKFHNISKVYYPSTVALDDVSFEIKPQEFVSIVGRSGSGKTTLLKMIIGEEEPTQGRILFHGSNIQMLDSKKISELRRKVGAVFQDYKLIPSKTAFENVAYILEVTGASDEEINRDVKEVLEIVELDHRANHFPVQLSGGEKQRLAIARALIHRPEIILADEPTASLDPYHTLDIIRLLLKINELGTTVVLATHNKEIINSLKKRVITIQDGKIIRDEEKGRFVI